MIQIERTKEEVIMLKNKRKSLRRSCRKKMYKRGLRKAKHEVIMVRRRLFLEVMERLEATAGSLPDDMAKMRDEVEIELLEDALQFQDYECTVEFKIAECYSRIRRLNRIISKYSYYFVPPEKVKEVQPPFILVKKEKVEKPKPPETEEQEIKRIQRLVGTRAYYIKLGIIKPVDDR